MTNFLSRFWMILSVLVVLMMSLGTVKADVTNSETQLKKKTIAIGIYAPFTKGSAYIGRNMLGAMEIARDQLKSTDINYEFYTLDKVPQNGNAATTLQKFIDAHHINILLTEGAKTGAEVAPLAKKNKLIHFCLGGDAVMTDGKNNFHAQNPNHQRGAILPAQLKPEFIAQFKQEYFSHPVTEAGYAYDIFHLVNSSAQIAMAKSPDISTQIIVNNLLAQQTGNGMMGSFSLDKKGIFYNKEKVAV